MSLPLLQSPVREQIELMQRERIVRLDEYYSRPMPEKRGPVKVEFKKMMYAMPFLWLSGVFTGIGIMLMT